MNTKTISQQTAVLLILQALLIFAPLIILGGAIDWPASLDEPAEVMLPRIHEEINAVRTGYFIYLVYSILFLPMAVLTVNLLRGTKGDSAWLNVAVGFAAVSALARTLGIIRWLVPMLELAEMYVDPTTSEQTRESIEVSYTLLNAYGGAIGEILGVGIFAALWLGIVAGAMWRSAVFPKWMAGFGFVAAIGLGSAVLEIFGVDLGGLISVTVTIFHVWLLAVGGWILWKGRPVFEKQSLVVARS